MGRLKFLAGGGYHWQLGRYERLERLKRGALFLSGPRTGWAARCLLCSGQCERLDTGFVGHPKSGSGLPPTLGRHDRSRLSNPARAGYRPWGSLYLPKRQRLSHRYLATYRRVRQAALPRCGQRGTNAASSPQRCGLVCEHTGPISWVSFLGRCFDLLERRTDSCR